MCEMPCNVLAYGFCCDCYQVGELYKLLYSEAFQVQPPESSTRAIHSQVLSVRTMLPDGTAVAYWSVQLCDVSAYPGVILLHVTVIS